MATREWREANREKIKKYKRDYYWRNADYCKQCVADYRKRVRKSRPQIIVENCRASDKPKRLICDVDVSFVAGLIQNGCFYCGDTENLMTLDRIDNEKGHMKTNVNPACFRCNNIRNNMPYEAWMSIVPSVRFTHESGLFGNWKKR